MTLLTRSTLVGLTLVATLSACDFGPSAFVAQNNLGPGSPGGTGTAQGKGASNGGANGGSVGQGVSPIAAQQRTVQEADIYKLVGNTLYILNAYRGLQIVDVTNPASPILVGRVPVVG